MKIKSKRHKKRKCIIKQKHKLQGYKYCFRVTQIENRINHFEKNIIDVVSLKEDQK